MYNISINGRQISYKYIIVTNSLVVSCVLSQSLGCTIWKTTALCYTYMIVIKI